MMNLNSIFPDESVESLYNNNDFRQQAQGIYSSLCAPVHESCLRDWESMPDFKREADLTGGIHVALADVQYGKILSTALDDFQCFMHVAMGVKPQGKEYKINILIRQSNDWPGDSVEAFQINTSQHSCEIIASNPDSVRRALVYLEDEMTARRAPFLTLGKQTRWSKIAERITRSPIAPYRWKTGWELLDNNDYYPDNYLNNLAHCGVNGIWVAGLFRTLIHSDVLPELGPPEHRLKKLKQLVAKAARYGIKVYFFCIEPRFLTPDHPVFQAHPEIQGATINGICSLCTSTPLVQEYIKQTTCELFQQVPQLGGIINIFNGERLTNCWLNEKFAATCPRCSQRDQIDVLREDLDCFAQGIELADSSAHLYAWAYYMDSDDSLKVGDCNGLLQVIKQSHPKIVWIGNFEHGGSKEIGNKKVIIDEYSLSYTGPCNAFVKIANAGRDSGHRVCSKLQIGTSYELSSTPYLPIPGKVFDKFQAMKSLDVTGSMLSWIPGGFPGVMLKAAGEASFADSVSKREFLLGLARKYADGRNVAKVADAWEKFEVAIEEYPFTNRFLYFGPITRAPAYPLVLSPQKSRAMPYNWGLDKNRNPQPFDEAITEWFGPFSYDEIVRQLVKMLSYWQDGLEFLKPIAKDDVKNRSLHQMLNVSLVIHGQLKSTLNVIRFLHTRNMLSAATHREQEELIKQLKAILNDEIENVLLYINNVENDPTIGYQSEIMGYSFTPKTMKEKIKLTRMSLEQLDEWHSYISKPVESCVLPDMDKPWNVELWGD